MNLFRVSLFAIVCFLAFFDSNCGGSQVSDEPQSVLQPIEGEAPPGGDCFWPTAMSLEPAPVRVVVSQFAVWTKATLVHTCARAKAAKSRVKPAALVPRRLAHVG